jgi:Zn-finger domain-containing protein
MANTITASGYELRFQQIETMLNTMQIAMNNLATKRELNGLVLVLTNQITDLQDTVEDLEVTVSGLVP